MNDTLPTVENPAVEAFRKAEQIVWSRMDTFQRAAINDCRKNPNREDQHVIDTFAKEIALLVECELNTKAESYQHFLAKQRSR